MKKGIVILGVSSALLLGGTNLAVAGDKVKEPNGISPASIEQANLANRLIAYGDERQDPILLLAAARLQKAMTDTAPGAASQSTDTDDVLKRAKEMAKGQKDVQNLIEDLQTSKGREYHLNGCSGCTGSYYTWHP